MTREEIRNDILNYLRDELQAQKPNKTRQDIQMGNLYGIFDSSRKGLGHVEQRVFYSIIRETVQQFINNGILYVGTAGDPNAGYPWLTITSYGKRVIEEDEELPYDPDGYINRLEEKMPNLAPITLAYIAEAVATYNRRHLLSATLMLGVASENEMLNLIEAYLSWIKEPERQSKIRKKIDGRGVFQKYKIFRDELNKDIKEIPSEYYNYGVYLDGIFNFIRLNRNSAGHPIGVQVDARTIYANLMVFADYVAKIEQLIDYFQNENIA